MCLPPAATRIFVRVREPRCREARVWIPAPDAPRLQGAAGRAWRMTLALLAVSVLAGVGWAVELAPMPDTDLSAEEPEVRAQLEARLQGLEQLLDGWSQDSVRGDDRAVAVAEAFAEVGGLHYVYGHLQVAQTAFENALLLAGELDHPRRLEWVYLLAVVRTDLGATDAALAGLDDVLEVRPKDLAALIRKAELLVDQGRFEQAEDVFSRAQQVSPNEPAVLGGLGTLASRQGRHEQAIEWIQEALEQQPEADSLNYVLGQSLRAVGRVDEARAALRRNKQGLTRFPDPWVDRLGRDNVSSMALMHEANSAMRRGEMDRAGSLYQRFLLRQPDDALATYNLGLTQLARQQREEGFASLRRAIELDPEFSAPHFFLASALAEDGLMEDALVHYRRAHELDPNEADVLAEYATALAQTGRSREALALLEPAVAEQPRAHQLRLRYAVVLITLGRVDESRPMLETLSRPGVENAIQAEALYHRALLDLRAGRAGDARDKLERSRALDPGSATTKVALAQVLAAAGELAPAYELYAAASQARPRDDRAQFGRAMVLLLLDRDAEAVEALESALEWLPGHTGLRHLLARVLAASDSADARDGARAVTLAESLVREQLTMEHAETLAMALAEVGRYEEAIVWQQRILDRARASGAPGPVVQRLQSRLDAFRSGTVLQDPWESP